MTKKQFKKWARDSAPYLKESYKTALMDLAAGEMLDPVRGTFLEKMQEFTASQASQLDWTEKEQSEFLGYAEEAVTKTFEEVRKENEKLFNSLFLNPQDAESVHDHVRFIGSFPLSLDAIKAVGGIDIIDRMNRRSHKTKNIIRCIDDDGFMADPKMRQFYNDVFIPWVNCKGRTSHRIGIVILRAMDLYTGTGTRLALFLCYLDVLFSFSKSQNRTDLIESLERIHIPDLTHIFKKAVDYSAEDRADQSMDVALIPTTKHSVKIRAENIFIQHQIQQGGLPAESQRLIELICETTRQKKAKKQKAEIRLPELAAAMGINRHDGWYKYQILAKHFLDLLGVVIRIGSAENSNVDEYRVLAHVGRRAKKDNFFLIEPEDATQAFVEELDRAIFEMPDATYSYFKARPYVHEGRDYWRLERIESVLVRAINARALQCTTYGNSPPAEISISLETLWNHAGIPITPNQARRDLMRVIVAGLEKIRDNPGNARISGFHVTFEGQDIAPQEIRQVFKNKKKIVFHIALSDWHRRRLVDSRPPALRQ